MGGRSQGGLGRRGKEKWVVGAKVDWKVERGRR